MLLALAIPGQAASIDRSFSDWPVVRWTDPGTLYVKEKTFRTQEWNPYCSRGWSHHRIACWYSRMAPSRAGSIQRKYPDIPQMVWRHNGPSGDHHCVTAPPHFAETPHAPHQHLSVRS